MSTRETFAAELEALVDKYGHSLSDNEVISTLEQALSRAWGFACEPQPASLFAAAPELRDNLQSIIDWADFALRNPGEFDSHGVRNLDGPAFDKARATLAAAEGR